MEKYTKEFPDGRHSYRYRTEKGEISLLHPCRWTMNEYEIYSISGGAFDDIERYETLEEAESRINKLLL